MKRLGTPWIIHGFALLHAAGTVVCSLAGWPDSMLLTALTMALAVLICYRAKLTVEITIAALFLVNIIGFVVGNLGARFLAVFLPPLLHHSITTFLVTELLGWALLLFGRTVAPHGAAGYERKVSWRHNWGWLVFAIVAVLGLRIWFGLTYSGDFLAETGVMGILMIITVLTLAYMVTFAVQMQREASSQRTRRHQAEFRYMTLKHQVNPHFLFNSLNVLDSIVQDGTREEASAYIHKMAELYRYLMQQEGKRLVPLADEIGFARTYRELMQIRFPEGLQFKGLDPARIPDGSIVPCTLQLLLENAIKHNALSAGHPLVLSVTTDGASITLTNNRIPKVTPPRSTGIGLQYIRNQYRDIADAEISVVETPDSFSVTIPILEESE